MRVGREITKQAVVQLGSTLARGLSYLAASKMHATLFYPI